MTPPPVSPGSLPLVSVVVPCRNEAAYVVGCLDSLLASGYPVERLEVLVVDGASDDGTADLVARYAATHAAVRLVPNPRRLTPVALNLGLAAARGDVIMLAGAHNAYPPGYVRALVDGLLGSAADGVGGVCLTCPGGTTPVAGAIALAMAHPLGVGNSHFRIGADRPRWVDTVPFGCYRRAVFERFGGFDEELARNQDDEFNLRLLRRGGRLLLLPHVESRYYTRDTLAKVWRMFFQYGFFKPLVLRKVGGRPRLRHLVPAAFVLALAASLGAAPWVRPARYVFLAIVVGYAAAMLAVAAAQGTRRGRAALLLPVVFPVLHFAYGLGFLRGAVALLRRRAPAAGLDCAVPLSR